MKHLATFTGLAALACTLAAAPAAAQSTPAVEKSRDALPANADSTRIETVDADLARTIGTWTGVRSCSDASRAQSALQAAFDRWIGQQTMARPGKLLLTYGWSEAKWWSQNRTSGWPSRRRSCKGGYSSAKVYARFY